MGKLLKKASLICKRSAAFLLLAALIFGFAAQAPVMTQAAGVKCKTLCQAVLKGTGNGDKLKYQTTSASDVGCFSVSDRDKISSIMYLCDAKEVYSVCVAKASSKSNASALLKVLKSYKSNNSSSDYLNDYSSDEQKVFKNAICGKSGKYVWYIAMSPKKSVNKKGQTQLKKTL